MEPFKELPNEIAQNDMYDENGIVDGEFLTAILEWMADWAQLQIGVQAALNKLLGCDDRPDPKNKKKGGEGTKWSASEILRHCTLEDNVLKLPDVQFSKKSYDEAKKWILEAGGSWQGGKVQGFTFPFNAGRVFSILHKGERCKLQQEYQYFGTPPVLADALVGEVDNYTEGCDILEPSAGQGAIIDAIHRRFPTASVDYYELMPENKEIMARKERCTFMGDDFLQSGGKQYDIIVANPPFSNNQDIRHVYTMYERLKQGGTLATITGPHWTMGTELECEGFRKWLQRHDAKVSEIAEGAFKESGTAIKTMMLVIKKPTKED